MFNHSDEFYEGFGVIGGVILLVVIGAYSVISKWITGVCLSSKSNKNNNNSSPLSNGRVAEVILRLDGRFEQMETSMEGVRSDLRILHNHFQGLSDRFDHHLIQFDELSSDVNKLSTQIKQ